MSALELEAELDRERRRMRALELRLAEDEERIEALRIMEAETHRDHLDRWLVETFIQEKVWVPSAAG